MEDSEGDAGELAAMGTEVLKVLDAEAVVVTLQNGNVVKGSPESFSLRKRTKKDTVSWSGKLSVETDSGVLEMDCANIESIKRA